MQKKNSGQGLVEYGLILGLVAVVAIAAFGIRGTSDGSYVGKVTGYAYRGIYWQTHEGDLLIGGQGTVTNSHWNFTVDDEKVAAEVKQALNKQELVELVYHEYYWVNFWNGETRYFVNSVKVVSRSPTAEVSRTETDKK